MHVSGSTLSDAFVVCMLRNIDKQAPCELLSTASQDSFPSSWLDGAAFSHTRSPFVHEVPQHSFPFFLQVLVKPSSSHSRLRAPAPPPRESPRSILPEVASPVVPTLVPLSFHSFTASRSPAFSGHNTSPTKRRPPESLLSASPAPTTLPGTGPLPLGVC